MKVLFLDVDGVLNSHDWFKRRPNAEHRIDPAAVKLLDEVIARTGCVVVLSSMWRTIYTLPHFVRMLVPHGLLHADLFIGVTPEHPGVRGSQIATWLGAVGGVVESFAIVDDDSDMEPYMDRLVQTEFACGLQRGHVERLVRMLNK